MIKQIRTACVVLCLLSATATAAERQLTRLQVITGPEEQSLSLPTDIASARDRVYIVDSMNHRVQIYDRNGNYLLSFGGKGKEKGQLDSPVGIDVAKNGEVYVADTGNKRIAIFSRDGQFLRSFRVKTGRYIIRPVDVLVDEIAGEIYVTGNDNHKVMVFSLKGKLKRQWGDNGINEGEFRYPATLAQMHDGRIAVVDVLNSRLQLFEKNGRYSAQISGWGVSPGHVFRPKGVAIDRRGNFYISDSYLNVVQVFNDEGKFLSIIKPDDEEGFKTPVGMTVDERDRLYVTEMRKNRVSVFSLK